MHINSCSLRCGAVFHSFLVFLLLFLFFNKLCLLVVFVTVMLIVELRCCYQGCPLLSISIERDANPSCRKDVKIGLIV